MRPKAAETRRPIPIPPVHERGPISVSNQLVNVTLGVVRAENIVPTYSNAEFEQELDKVISVRAHGLTDEQDAVRRAARDMLRNGRYKPTGRGKPASEYLLRSAQTPETFPRINWPVDVCNFISLTGLLPVSIWDLDKAQCESFAFRLGRSDEEYIFNDAGQVISLTDLVVGCAIQDNPEGRPIVNPVKDCLATKTSERTRRVGACVYAPNEFEHEQLALLCERFAAMLSRAGLKPDVAYVIASPGEEVQC